MESLNRHEYRQFWGPTGGGDSTICSDRAGPARRESLLRWHRQRRVLRHEGWRRDLDLLLPHAVATNPCQEILRRDGRDVSDEPPNLPPNVDLAAPTSSTSYVSTANPDRLWGQAHIGVFRTEDGAETWEDVTAGLPSFHGFPIAVTKREPDAAFVVPLEFEDNTRVCPGQFAVYRSRGGKSWQRLTNGLPGPDNYQSVYREGLDTDGLDSEGIYVGTSNGQVLRAPTGATTGSDCRATFLPYSL